MPILKRENTRAPRLEFKNAAKIDPKNVDAHIKLGETYLKLGNSQGAFGAYSRVEQLDENNLDAQLKMATFYMLGKQNEEAQKRIDEYSGQRAGQHRCALFAGRHPA